jgi:hypothetical protein
MGGYPSSASGYAANFQIGLASAGDSGLPEASAAWNLFDSRSIKPSGSAGYNNNPVFSVIPRSVQAGAQSPPTMPPTLNPPTTSKPPLVTVKPPPVPKELPARQCFGSECASISQPGHSAAPSRPVESPLPAQSISGTIPPNSNQGGISAAVTPSSTATIAQAPTRMLRLLRVVCSRFDAWCVRLLPQTLYIPAPQPMRSQQPIAGAEAAAYRTAAAPTMIPRQTSVEAPRRGLAVSVQRR